MTRSRVEVKPRQTDPMSQHLRGSTLLLMGRSVALAMNFLVQILTIQYLSKLDYGAFFFATSFVAIASALTIFGLGRTARRFVPIYHEQQAYSKLCGSIALMLGIILGIGMAIVLLVVGVATLFGESMAASPVAISLLLVLIALAPIEAIDSFLISLFAVFAQPRAIFVRRYLVRPGLKLAAVGAVILGGGNVVMLAIGYLVGGILGLLVCLGLIVRVLREQQLWKHFRGTLEYPTREILTYSLPQVGSDIAFQVHPD